MKKIKSFDFFEYVVDKYNNIWKYVKSKDHFIKVTPGEKGEDRRINRFEIERLIESGELVQMKGKPKHIKSLMKSGITMNVHGNTMA